MMQSKIFPGFLAIAVMALMASCGSSQGKQQTNTAADVQSQQAAQSQQATIDCDAFMHQIADDCYVSLAFEDDNTTPRHEFDEEGNDLGEVDQHWAAGFCECYAQLAFQTYGCTTVIQQMTEMDDTTLAETYEPIIATCEQPPEPPMHHHHGGPDGEGAEGQDGAVDAEGQPVENAEGQPVENVEGQPVEAQPEAAAEPAAATETQPVEALPAQENSSVNFKVE